MRNRQETIWDRCSCVPSPGGVSYEEKQGGAPKFGRSAGTRSGLFRLNTDRNIPTPEVAIRKRALSPGVAGQAP